MNHLINLPFTEGRTFKLGTGWYNLSHGYGHWRLIRVTDGKLQEKSELTNKSDKAIFSYLADAERCTSEEARSAYEKAMEVV